MDGPNRQDVIAYLQRWRKAGSALAEHRAAELANLADDAAVAAMLDLFRLWRRPSRDECGEELVEQQRIFARWRERHGAAR